MGGAGCTSSPDRRGKRKTLINYVLDSRPEERGTGVQHCLVWEENAGRIVLFIFFIRCGHSLQDALTGANVHLEPVLNRTNNLLLRSFEHENDL